MKSPIKYIGGKSRLAKTIIDLIPEHRTYCEAFAGAAWVFFTKATSKVEVINDLDGDLISMYRCIKNHKDEFLRQFEYVLPSRELFEDYRRQLEAGGLTDIQRAARYYYIQRLAFGGQVRAKCFSVDTNSRPGFNLERIEEHIIDAFTRLSRVTVENLSWERCLHKYDKDETFFYLDPPYYGLKEYRHNMDHADFENLALVLADIKGKFIMSINNDPEIKTIFNAFNIGSTDLLYTMDKGKNRKMTELLIDNFR